MENEKIIVLPTHNISIHLVDREVDENTDKIRWGSGSIEEEGTNSRRDYNNVMNGIKSMLLAHAIAGIDVESPAYLEGLETAIEGCTNNF